MRFTSRLHKYSWGNLLLIYNQRPDATYVAGFKAWLGFGRHVKKGEKGIAILAPMQFKKQDEAGNDTDESILRFRVAHVFDVSQTEGEPLPEPVMVCGEPAEKLIALESVIGGYGIEIREEFSPNALGMSLKGAILIRPDLEPAERFAVLAHELAHELLHDKEARKNATKKLKETEAESVAFVVCEAVGLDTKTRSSDYICLYNGDGETLSSSLDRIQQAASQIIEKLSEYAELKPDVSEHSHESSENQQTLF